MTLKTTFEIHHKDCYGLEGLEDHSIDALVTDPPYGINFQSHEWDKALPSPVIWQDCQRVMKPGAYGLVFSSIRLMHRLMVDLEDRGFLIRDVVFWTYLNGMPKTRNIGLELDKELRIPSEMDGVYQYVQGYKKGGAETYTLNQLKIKYKPASKTGKKMQGAGLGLKPAYNPVILIQKPLETGLNIAQNILKYGTGALNLEETRLPYETGEEGKVGHNPHPKGRLSPNFLRTQAFDDNYDKFFLIPKVRQKTDKQNFHPTPKPVELMNHLVKLVSFRQQRILDPFMGSGSTGLACKELKRDFVGYELEKAYFDLAAKRLNAE